jgi:hypothetical protein
VAVGGRNERLQGLVENLRQATDGGVGAVRTAHAADHGKIGFGYPDDVADHDLTSRPGETKAAAAAAAGPQQIFAGKQVRHFHEVEAGDAVEGGGFLDGDALPGLGGHMHHQSQGVIGELGETHAKTQK